MEEKVLALESLAALKGLYPHSKWNVHSILSIKKDYTSDTQNNLFLKNAKNVTKGTKPMINQDIKKEVIPVGFDVENKEDKLLLKPCSRVEIKRSETDIPKCDKPVMNTICDKMLINDNEKTKKSGNLECKEITPTKEYLKQKQNENSEEIRSNKSEEISNKIIEEKISSTVQEWVNHLPSKGDPNLKENLESRDVKEEDPVGPNNEEKPQARNQLSREMSLQSSSSLDSILDSRRPDPVEIFLNLGFGGLPGVDTENCRIPKRFLVPSKCKGGDWNEFLKRELLQAQNFECSSLGFRGLSGPSYRRPSAIVANIMEKLRERAVSQPHNRSRFSTVAKMVLNEKSVLNKLTPEFQSVLSPDSRKFLQNQGKKSPEVPRRRIIFGQKSFAFAHDGEFIEVDSSGTEEKSAEECPTILTTNNGEEESPTFPNSDVLLKLRRSSLQKQKNVEDDTDVDNVFFVVGNENSKDATYNNNDCSKKAGKIPQRFLSSTNLMVFEENNETMRLEVEREILSLSQKIKSISNHDLPSVLLQVKELRSKIENGEQEVSEM